STLTRSQGDAARALAPVAHAMTDVTGFGLAGHLMRMAEASGVTATLELAKVPHFPDAQTLADAGVRSSLWPANRSTFPGDAPASADLLFDPQTAGGLLAALPAEQAREILDDIRAAGHDAALIGTIVPRGDVSLRLT
ncbi:MAG: AIR synthase-related protein, partial [Silicimonas sp.]|nr:AIR synthase-related protein [Silicimonas sp.]